MLTASCSQKDAAIVYPNKRYRKHEVLRAPATTKNPVVSVATGLLLFV